jgi:hypothetical protein
MNRNRGAAGRNTIPVATIAPVVRRAGLVFDVPAERLKERFDESITSLCLGALFREIVGLVGLEIGDELL